MHSSLLNQRFKLDRKWLIAIVVGSFVGGTVALLGLWGSAGIPIILIGGTIACLIIQRPSRALKIFIVLLPAYMFTLVILYGVVGLSTTLIRAIQIWKEVVVTLTLLAVLLASYRHWPGVHLSRLDILIVSFLFLNLVYLAVPTQSVDFLTRLYGLRANAFFVVLYFLGRVILLGPRSQRVIIGLFVLLGVFTALGALFEKLFLDADWPLRLGYTRYVLTFFGDATIHNPNMLPWTFWTEAMTFRRPSAFFANPLDMAASMLITVPAIVSLILLFPRSRYRRFLVLILGILMLVLGMAFARMATISLLIAVVMLSIALRKRRLAVVPILLAGVTGVIFFIVGGEPVQRLVIRTLNFQNASSQGHVAAWREGMQAMLAYPFGLGLGTSGHIGDRFGSGTGGENQYITIGVELGWVGFFLYVSILLVGLRTCWKVVRHADDPYTRTLLGVALTSLFGLTFLGLTCQIGIYLFLTYVGWWLVGFAVQTGLTRSLARETSRHLSAMQIEVSP